MYSCTNLPAPETRPSARHCNTIIINTVSINHCLFCILHYTKFRANLWKPIRETYNEEIIQNQYLIQNYYLTLAHAKENWTGYVMDAEEETNIKQGDYVVIAKDNLERRPKTYYLISEKEAEMILDAKNNAEAFAIMNHIIQEKTAEHDQLFEDYER